MKRKMKNKFNLMRILPMIALVLFTIHSSLFTISCARMGSPDGGWYDDDPPYVVSSTPADQSVNVNAKKITILFNEYIKLEDATNKVIVSPLSWRCPKSRPQARR